MGLKIAIDAGHGLKTAGKRCLKSLDISETREWYLNDRIADKLQTLLKSYDCEVLRVDDTTGATDVALSTRVSKANSGKADVYVSIHHNAGVDGGTGGGTQVYYYSSKSARLTQAKALYKAIINKTGLVGNRAETVIKKDFYVVKNTTMPAFLIENGFMDSKTDVPIILKESHATKTANGILDFLIDTFDLKSSSYLVKITASTLNYRSGPGTSYSIKGTVKKGEVFTIVEEKNGWGKLKSGAGWIKLSYTEKK